MEEIMFRIMGATTTMARLNKIFSTNIRLLYDCKIWNCLPKQELSIQAFKTKYFRALLVIPYKKSKTIERNNWSS